jgi:hypothetical protein
MLTAVRVEIDDDPKDLIVQIYGESESEHRTFWIPGRASLYQVAGTCLGTRLDQIEDERMNELAASREEKSTKKKAT